MGKPVSLAEDSLRAGGGSAATPAEAGVVRRLALNSGSGGSGAFGRVALAAMEQGKPARFTHARFTHGNRASGSAANRSRLHALHRQTFRPGRARSAAVAFAAG